MYIRHNSTNFDKNQHSVYIMYYHLVLVVKYRRKVFDTEISDRAKAIFEYIAPGYGITMLLSAYGGRCSGRSHSFVYRNAGREDP
jgi:putative transposase